ncbi:MAG: putative thiol-disulfide oxidoreductase [Fibrobacteres bacterium]|nr:putative thiol-disulfide oxidoreductase [Fibrobacterota bacterium]
MPIPDASKTLILYDGVCGLCNRMIRFIILNDKAETFQFASLQSGLGAEVLSRYGRDPADVDTICVAPGFPERAGELLIRSRGALYIGKRLRAPWSLVARLLDSLPDSLLDLGYRIIAANRYRLFGKMDACPIPSPSIRKRFLDI